MKKSKRTKRMERHHRRAKKTSKLNLVSLMDIFTILVFFLLVNSSDVEVLQNDKTIKLPESVAEKKPEDTLVVVVSKEDILVGGRKVASLKTIMDVDAEISGLKKELDYLASRNPYADEEAEKAGRDINIMADKDTPYKLLKKVMATCAKAEFRNISLAVSQVASDDSSAVDASVEG
ncbi:ExbD/TolR family protein [Agaribacterium haliotis]|uniref:ExbD/TolR family protein n=1 Tax=Agaribacterium haliotis TaxID=2013869 RepID=UPI0018652AAC|nr:biopolymer transporter ExbD [Agaribacterium haliotis]